MLSILKNHPFAVEAFFESSIVLTFAIPKEDLRGLIPPCLELDTLNDKWAFIAVAMVQTKGLRPKGFPRFFGSDFFLIGYRVFVRYKNREGKRLRGLYILRSQTDKWKMEFLGNIFTHYRYTTSEIMHKKHSSIIEVSSANHDFVVTIDIEDKQLQLPSGSPFTDWKEARRFAGPLPFTFSYSPAKSEVLVIEGVRKNWTPRPVHVLNHKFSFLDEVGLKNPTLANAFIIENVPYYWKKGKLEEWKAS